MIPSNEGKGAASASQKGEGKPGVQDMTEQAYPHKYPHSRFQGHTLYLWGPWFWHSQPVKAKHSVSFAV